MRIPSPTQRRRARIEIIPLIDIIFFLLATFVMVSLSMVKNQGIPVNLPTVATGTPMERKDQVTISINESGQIFLNKEEVSLDQLVTQLADMKKSQPDIKVFINGDEKAFFGKAISILDEVRKLGITKVAVQTKKLTHGQP
jgi:biopolymer transport protein ExbD